MTTGLIVLSRFDSRRLPGKALRAIGDRPLLGRVVDRAKRVSGVDEIVVATSERAIDDVIADFASAEGVGVFRGHAEDVLGRCLACIDQRRFDLFVRISGDSPFMDPGLVDRMLILHQGSPYDIVTNVFPRSFPPGLSVEVVSAEAIRRLSGLTTDSEDREHVTRYFYRHPDEFRIHNVLAPSFLFDAPHLAVDDETDLARAGWITDQIGSAVEVSNLETIVALARRWESANRGAIPGAPEPDPRCPSHV